MANRLFQAFIDTAKNIAGYPITVANAVFMRDGSTLDEFSENIPHREDDEDTNIEVPNIDADMLNGHPADYYAKQSDLSALNNSVTQVNNKIGNTDVSKWGNSLTGAIKAACDKSDANEKAIADVNSNLIIESVEFIPSFSAYKVGHTLEIYKQFSDLGDDTYIELGITQYKSVNDYTILPLYSTAPPYLVVGSLWIYKVGNVALYKKSETTECFISGNYIFE